MANWTQEAEEHLVTMVEERPALYDIRESLYTNKVVKADLWRQIENKLVISEKFLKKRWESLRTQYTRYKKLPPSGSGGAQRTGRQQWILTRLQFLEPHTKKKDTTHNPAPMEDLGAPVDLDTRADDTSSFNIEVLSSPPHCETRSSTPVEEPCVSEAAPVPYAHMATSSISRSEPTTIPFSEEPCQTTKRDSSTSVPPTKRRRKMLEEPVSWESTNLMRIIGKTLERLGSREEQDDEISAYCKNIECRMRKLPRHVLPHFEHEVDICLYKYLVGQSPGNHSGPGCTADQPEVFPCSLPHMCLNRGK
ncbi:ATPase inhibitor A, mitochondrial isoform X1 [Myripristis murdjan]|uniref:ATPase inhibitor A, mitochondrial isoform X1 n=1 Tax=Myripristis murdjan TaxID=586833 RepID=UPI0011762A59|nr:ATPase inhibitor, mitochondrial isoform X1 [Myripristis murdjan]